MAKQRESAKNNLPDGWLLSGQAPMDYRVDVEQRGGRHCNPCAVLTNRKKEPSDFATLCQAFFPDEYKGHRVRLSGFLKTKKVKGGAGLWMRVDKDQAVLVLDNIWRRRIEGTTAWTRYDVVLDVAADATLLAFGVSLHGTGTVWTDSVTLEVVGNDVPVSVPTRVNHPVNLDFTGSMRRL